MEKNINNYKDLEVALLNVRKGYRLIRQYHERVFKVMYYIKEKYSMPYVLGNKRFSNALKRKRDGYLSIEKEIWAWDFMYSYEFEYYFGEVWLEKGIHYGLSIVQLSDTGYYQSESGEKNKIETFESVENSDSLLVFLFETISKEEEEWTWFERFDDKLKQMLRNGEDVIQIDDKHLIVTYPIARFLNQKSTDKVLKEFSDKVIKMCNIQLLKNETAL